LLTNASLPGRVLHTLIGYEAMPSGMQAVFYTATLLLILGGMHFFRAPPRRPAAT
jgi:high-affinity iron transporter